MKPISFLESEIAQLDKLRALGVEHRVLTEEVELAERNLRELAEREALADQKLKAFLPSQIFPNTHEEVCAAQKELENAIFLRALLRSSRTRIETKSAVISGELKRSIQEIHNGLRVKLRAFPELRTALSRTENFNLPIHDRVGLLIQFCRDVGAEFPAQEESA